MKPDHYEMQVQVRWAGTRWEASVSDYEGEFASVMGGGDLWPVLQSLVPYMASLCVDDPFHAVLRQHAVGDK